MRSQAHDQRPNSNFIVSFATKTLIIMSDEEATNPFAVVLLGSQHLKMLMSAAMMQTSYLTS